MSNPITNRRASAYVLLEQLALEATRDGDHAAAVDLHGYRLRVWRDLDVDEQARLNAQAPNRTAFDPPREDHASWSGLRVYKPSHPGEAGCCGCTSRESTAVDIEASIGSQRMPLVGFGLCAVCAVATARELLEKSGMSDAVVCDALVRAEERASGVSS